MSEACAGEGIVALTNVETIADYLQTLAPTDLAATWDNVGLLLGDREAPVRRVMTCLTVTGDSVAEAIEGEADLVVSHHPLPFRPLQRITKDTPEGRYLLDLAHAKIALYSAHTAFDSAARGINQRIAEGLELRNIEPLVVKEDDATLGSGRYGEAESPITSAELGERLKKFLGIESLRLVGAVDRSFTRIGIACGSAGSYLEPATECECEALVTGETTFHTCLAAEAQDVVLLLTGHFASERFALERLAEEMDKAFADVQVWASKREKDPLQLI